MRACLLRITLGVNDCVISPVWLDVALMGFVGFSLLRELRGVNAVAKGDREDCRVGKTGESLVLLAERLAGVGMSRGTKQSIQR